jgi:hypothetical protein
MHHLTIVINLSCLASFIAIISPAVCIVALVNITSIVHRLAAIEAFNGVMFICLVYFTDTRRIDLFLITAA